MSEEKVNKPEDQEIDLTVVIKKVSTFYEKILASIFQVILYVKRKILKLILIFVIGIGLGFYFDENTNEYKSEVIVSPNLGGYDFVYSKIELIQSKVEEQDSVFFKKIGVQDLKKLKKIIVAPIIDVYGLVNNSTSATSAQHTENFELIKLLSEGSTLNKVISEEITSRNYGLHKISIFTDGSVPDSKIIDPIIAFLNSDKYFNSVLSVSRDNINIKMKENEKLIKKVDSVTSILTLNLQKNKVGNSLVYNSENNQLNPMFELKNNLINEVAAQKISLIKMNYFVKETSRIANLKSNRGINGKLKLIFPMLFLLFFILYKLSSKFYARQMNKLKEKQVQQA